MNRSLRALLALGLLSWVGWAQAMYFAYLPGPDTARLTANGLPFPIILVDAGCCSFLDTTFHVSSSVTTGVGGLLAHESLDATLTTDAQGHVLAWQFSGLHSNRFRTVAYASSNQGGQFEEWIQLTPWLVGVAEGPVYSAGPASWVMSAVPIPEPGTGGLLAAGLAVVCAAATGARRRRIRPAG
jgi:hypothetical protein